MITGCPIGWIIGATIGRATEEIFRVSIAISGEELLPSRSSPVSSEESLLRRRPVVKSLSGFEYGL